MTTIDEIILEIEQLFTKKPNTIYEVKLVDQIYSGQINIYFQYYKIGYATTVQQIARLDGEIYREKLPEIAQKNQACHRTDCNTLDWKGTPVILIYDSSFLFALSEQTQRINMFVTVTYRDLALLGIGFTLIGQQLYQVKRKLIKIAMKIKLYMNEKPVIILRY